MAAVVVVLSNAPRLKIEKLQLTHSLTHDEDEEDGGRRPTPNMPRHRRREEEEKESLRSKKTPQ